MHFFFPSVRRCRPSVAAETMPVSYMVTIPHIFLNLIDVALIVGKLAPHAIAKMDEGKELKTME